MKILAPASQRKTRLDQGMDVGISVRGFFIPKLDIRSSNILNRERLVKINHLSGEGCPISRVEGTGNLSHFADIVDVNGLFAPMIITVTEKKRISEIRTFN